MPVSEEYWRLRALGKCVDCYKSLGSDYEFVRCPVCLAKHHSGASSMTRGNDALSPSVPWTQSRVGPYTIVYGNKHRFDLVNDCNLISARNRVIEIACYSFAQPPQGHWVIFERRGDPVRFYELSWYRPDHDDWISVLHPSYAVDEQRFVNGLEPTEIDN